MSPNVIEASLFLINSLFGLYTLALILRVVLQAVRADFYNPLSQLVWKVTQPPVALLQKLIPKIGRFDVAAILLAWVICCLNVAAALALTQSELPIAVVLAVGLYRLAIRVLWLYIFSILLQAILSWTNPAPTPMTSLLWSINEPLLGPVRKILPPAGGMDWSPLVVTVGLYFLLILIGA